MNTPITDKFQSGLPEICDKLNATLHAMRVLELRYNKEADHTKAVQELAAHNHNRCRMKHLMYLEQYKATVAANKGLNRQARKIKRLKARIAELES